MCNDVSQTSFLYSIVRRLILVENDVEICPLDNDVGAVVQSIAFACHDSDWGLVCGQQFSGEGWNVVAREDDCGSVNHFRI